MLGNQPDEKMTDYTLSIHGVPVHHESENDDPSDISWKMICCIENMNVVSCYS